MYGTDGLLLTDALLYCAVVWLCYKLCDWLIHIPKLTNHSQRYIVITGCDSGFGLASSKLLASRGCHVFAACLTQSGQDTLNGLCLKNLKAFRMDIADEKSVAEGLRYVQSQLPEDMGLWGLINNAAVPGLEGPIAWLIKDNYQSVLDVNLLGLIHVTTTFLPLVKKQKGRVVNVSSMLGRTAIGPVPYSVAKYGVESFSDSLRREVRPFGVSVHVIEPSAYRSGMTEAGRMEASLRRAWGQCSAQTREEYGEQYLDTYIRVVYRRLMPSVVHDDVSPVLSAYEHAMIGRFPRPRYVVGLDARLVLLPIQCLPEWLGDWLHELMARGRPLPAAVS